MAVRVERSVSPGSPRGAGAQKIVGAMGRLFRSRTHVWRRWARPSVSGCGAQSSPPSSFAL
eukprot:1224497-Pyramimonas_sp.AAC.1